MIIDSNVYSQYQYTFVSKLLNVFVIDKLSKTLNTEGVNDISTRAMVFPLKQDKLTSFTILHTESE